MKYFYKIKKWLNKSCVVGLNVFYSELWCYRTQKDNVNQLSFLFLFILFINPNTGDLCNLATVGEQGSPGGVMTLPVFGN